MSIEIKCRVKLSLTAEQWRLYDIPGASAAARSINAGVAKALNAGDPDKAFEVLEEFSRFGASDTEPQGVLNFIMDEMRLP